METVQVRLRWLGNLVIKHSRSPYLFLVLIVIAFMKSGLVDMSTSPDQISGENETFPYPSGILTPISYGMRIVNFVANPETRSDTLIIGVVSLIFVLIALFLLVTQIINKVERCILITVVFLGPITAVLMGNMGRNDAFLILGSVIAAIAIPLHPSQGVKGGVNARLGILFSIGTTLMILGNPEQSVVSMLLLLALTVTPTFRPILPFALFGFVVSVLIFAVLAFWAGTQHSPNRFALVGDFWSQSIQNFAVNSPLVIFSGFGVAWILIVILFLQSRIRDLFILVPTLVIAPIAVTASTVDQTRVWVGVTTLACIAVVRFVASAVSLRQCSEIVGALLVIAIILPSIEVTYLGEIRGPFDYLYFLVQNNLYR